MTFAPPRITNWKAVLTSSDPLIGEAAPPARMEYLTAINNAVLSGLTTPYAAVAFFNWYSDGDPLPEWSACPQVFAPATRAFVFHYGRSVSEFSSGALDPCESFSFDDSATFDPNKTVSVEAPFAEGADAWPMTKLVAGVYADANETVGATPSSHAHAVTESRDSRLVRMLAKKTITASGVPFQSSNLADI